MNNYPPGVTGREYAIAGPDYEHSTMEYCYECDSDVEGMEYGYGLDRWFVCDAAGHENDLPDRDDDRDEDASYDRYVDQMLAGEI